MLIVFKSVIPVRGRQKTKMEKKRRKKDQVKRRAGNVVAAAALTLLLVLPLRIFQIVLITTAKKDK
jgi:uncharacterized membrane protein